MGREIKQITPEDYRFCEDCNMVFDYWKYDSLEDAGHEGHKVRKVTEQEFWDAVEQCRKGGCFKERHFDESKNRTCPDGEHQFEYAENFRNEILVKDETVEIPVRCKYCGVEAWEVWIYSCIMNDDGEMLQI